MGGQFWSVFVEVKPPSKRDFKSHEAEYRQCPSSEHLDDPDVSTLVYGHILV